MSRSELVSATGLTRSAIGGLVAELNELGLVREHAATSDGSPGRPSPVARVDGAVASARSPSRSASTASPPPSWVSTGPSFILGG